ncbi:Protein of unknown function [Luteibacter sp. UNCMF331Sha3.1]|uniref:DUF3325 domain-containing protein n=1 Tax=Luteibacter sp. UNCMF331Sha3.1 TaxID=1502760 RepID=UPI0008B6B73C|nr:DUF3325 domain-containing protein [Luteibacter sp. UNCMF331Sha3.1]SEN17058.1 Protein of unknown function [Luteibacter sp. UNCMF331Sha3.1]
MVLCLPIAIVGFMGLCLGMSRHQRDVLGRVLSPMRSALCKAFGWTALASSFALAIARDGAAMGAVYWAGMLSLAAVLVALWTTWFSRR